ncbi:MAG TPA: c-type cytochrome biogenesis protein CcmI [Casimicrobiaceae bacterium]|nr:c-type cytochrome biogenesis protein CcmI [Casimicrobiaceae bacterium]
MNSVPIFWAVALVLLALTVTVLLRPLMRRRAPSAPSEAAARLAVYRDQKRQLDDDLAAGVLAPAEHAASVDELARRLGVELDQAAQATSEERRERSSFVAALAVVAIIPAGAIVLYLVLGAPDALRARTEASARPDDAQIMAMVDSLAAKMQANPADPKGWRLLGRSYAALGRYNAAAKAYANAVQRGGENADDLTDWAEVLALAHDRTVSGEPEQLAKRALAVQPDHPKALALLATAAFERRDFDGSIALWRRLQSVVPAGGEDAAQTAAAIAEIERVRAGASSLTQAPGSTGTASSPVATSSSASSSSGISSPSAAASSPRAPSSSAAAPGSAAVAGQIDIAPALASKISPGDTLYVFARARNGPRMPLAVWRTTTTQWPRPFRLDDTMAMAGGPKLSSVDAVIIEARVSHSGDATPHPGDVMGPGVEAKPGAQDVRVVLDHTVP